MATWTWKPKWVEAGKINNERYITFLECLKFTYINRKYSRPFKVSIPCEKYWSGSLDWGISGAQEQLWSDALPGATNDPDGVWTHSPLTMCCKCYPLSHGCSLNIHKLTHVIFVFRAWQALITIWFFTVKLQSWWAMEALSLLE